MKKEFTDPLSSAAVWVNQYNVLSNAVPFGGVRQSGIGRELGLAGIKEYLCESACAGCCDETIACSLSDCHWVVWGQSGNTDHTSRSFAATKSVHHNIGEDLCVSLSPPVPLASTNLPSSRSSWPL